jgi:hypothetical protein
VTPIKPVPVVPEIYYPNPILGSMSGLNPLLGRQLEEEIEQRQHQQVEEFKQEQALENRVKDIRNRMELRQMLAEYEAGNLKPPIYRSDQIFEGLETDNMNIPNNNGGAFPAQYVDTVANVDKTFYGNDKNRIKEDEQRDYKRTDSYFKVYYNNNSYFFFALSFLRFGYFEIFSYKLSTVYSDIKNLILSFCSVLRIRNIKPLFISVFLCKHRLF